MNDTTAVGFATGPMWAGSLAATPFPQRRLFRYFTSEGY